MRLRESLEAVAEISPAAFEDLRRDIDREWVLQALEATGTATLRALRSHVLAAVAFGPYETSEIAYAVNLWSSVPRDSLTIVDRGFLSARILIPLARGGTNRHWLIRTKKNQRWRVLKRLGSGDALVEMNVSSEARKKDPGLPKVWVARAIRYQRKGFRAQTLLTSLLDPKHSPPTRSRPCTMNAGNLSSGTRDQDRDARSRRSDPQQEPRRDTELWGVFLTYNLVRLEMECVAADAGVEPTRITVVAALRLICDECLWCAVATPGAIPKHLRNLRAELKTLILPPRRSQRRYPRAVKIKTSNYAQKRRKGSKSSGFLLSDRHWG